MRLQLNAIRSARKTFLSVCGGCIILLLFSYIYLAELPEGAASLTRFVTRREVLQAELFRNSSRTRVPEICSREAKSTTNATIILVLSDPQSSVRRQVIRYGWAQRHVSRALDMHVLFVIAEEGHNDQAVVDLESEMFGDIIHVHLDHPPTEVALQTVTASRWVLENCPKIHFVVTTKDTVFVDIFALRKFLQGLSPVEALESTTSHFAKVYPVLEQRENFGHQKVLEIAIPEEDRLQSSERSRDLKYKDPEMPDPADEQEGNESPAVSLKYVETATAPTVHLDRTLHCAVRHNVTVGTSDWQRLSNRYGNLKFSSNPPYCADLTFVAALAAVKRLTGAYEDAHSEETARWPGDFYITAMLARIAGLEHSDIGRRYLFGIGNMDDVNSGEAVFVHLGKYADTLNTLLWQRVIEREHKMGNVNIIA